MIIIITIMIIVIITIVIKKTATTIGNLRIIIIPLFKNNLFTN